MSSIDISIFHQKSAIFIISKNADIVFKGCVNKSGSNFDNVSKIGYSRPS